jgi:hypothetical protein
MKKVFILMTGIVILLSFTFDVQAGDMKFPVMITYIGGLGDVYDLYTDNIEQSTNWEIQSIDVCLYFRTGC